MSKKIFIILLVCSFFFRLQAQEKRALLVGISKYDTALTGYQWNNINGANDVKLLAPILKAKGFNPHCSHPSCNSLISNIQIF